MLRFKYMKLKIQSNCINEKHTNTENERLFNQKVNTNCGNDGKIFFTFSFFFILVNFLQRMYIPFFTGKY